MRDSEIRTGTKQEQKEKIRKRYQRGIPDEFPDPKWKDVIKGYYYINSCLYFQTVKS